MHLYYLSVPPLSNVAVFGTSRGPPVSTAGENFAAIRWPAQGADRWLMTCRATQKPMVSPCWKVTDALGLHIFRNYHFKKVPIKTTSNTWPLEREIWWKMDGPTLAEINFGSEYFGCSTQTADWETKITEQTSSNSFAKVKDWPKLAGTT